MVTPELIGCDYLGMCDYLGCAYYDLGHLFAPFDLVCFKILLNHSSRFCIRNLIQNVLKIIKKSFNPKLDSRRRTKRFTAK